MFDPNTLKKIKYSLASLAVKNIIVIKQIQITQKKKKKKKSPNIINKNKPKIITSTIKINESLYPNSSAQLVLSPKINTSHSPSSLLINSKKKKKTPKTTLPCRQNIEGTERERERESAV
jgi:hypothetical protein